MYIICLNICIVIVNNRGIANILYLKDINVSKLISVSFFKVCYLKTYENFYILSDFMV